MIFFPWLETVNCAILKCTKGKQSRSYNCRVGPWFLAVVSACVGRERQYWASSRFCASRAEVSTQCCHLANTFPVLPFCFTIASADLSVPLPLLLVIRRATLTTYVGICEDKQRITNGTNLRGPSTHWLLWDCYGLSCVSVCPPHPPPTQMLKT